MTGKPTHHDDQTPNDLLNEHQHQSQSIEARDAKFTQEEIVLLKKILKVLCPCGNRSTDQPSVREKIVYQDRIVEKVVHQERIVEKSDPIRLEIRDLFAVLDTVRHDAELNRLWLAEKASDGAALIQLTAKLAQWETLEQLWDFFKNRCIDRKEGLTENESAILFMALSMVNYSLSNRKAKLEIVAAGTQYDYERHQSLQKSGDQIITTLLPALINPAGVVVRMPLVSRG